MMDKVKQVQEFRKQHFWPVMNEMIQLAVFGTFLFAYVNEFMDLKTVNEELYYAVCINMWIMVIFPLINV